MRKLSIEDKMATMPVAESVKVEPAVEKVLTAGATP
jgi:hypothetical protein